MDESVQTIIANRREKTLVLGQAHAMARDRANRLHYRLGVPVVILVALVGTSAFANLSDVGQSKILIGIATGALSILATVLSALQTFMDYGGLAKAHGAAANRLNALNRRIDRLARLKEDMIWEEVSEIDEALDKIIEESPPASADLQRSAWKSTRAFRYTVSSLAGLLVIGGSAIGYKLYNDYYSYLAEKEFKEFHVCLSDSQANCTFKSAFIGCGPVERWAEAVCRSKPQYTTLSDRPGGACGTAHMLVRCIPK